MLEGGEAAGSGAGSALRAVRRWWPLTILRPERVSRWVRRPMNADRRRGLAAGVGLGDPDQAKKRGMDSA